MFNLKKIYTILAIFCAPFLINAQIYSKYFHDNVNRITEVHNSDCSYVSYCYDSDGNRLCQSRTYISDLDGSVYSAKCGLPNGYIELDDPQGKNYAYKWSNGQTGLHIYNLAPGIYYLTITDLSNKNNYSCVKTYQVFEAPNPIINASITGPTNFCMGDSVILKSSTGKDYAYQWYLNGNKIIGAMDSFLVVKLPGIFSVEITKDYCSKFSNEITISVNSSPHISASVTFVTCYNAKDGIITATASQSKPPYKYSLDRINYQASGVFSSLPAGSYTIYVLDANGCISSLNVQVDQPSAALTANIKKINISCNGFGDGRISVFGVGGTPPYMYSLDNGVPNSTGTFSNLNASGHLIKVTDLRGCVFTQNVLLSEPLPLIASSIVIDNVKCFGENTGSIDIKGSGGTSPYQYSINNGSKQPTGSFKMLKSGSYFLQIFDANNCVYSQNVLVPEPLPLIAQTILVDFVKCFGGSDGSIQVIGSGGVQPYRYSLNGNLPTSNGVFKNLNVGTYLIRIYDANDCIYSMSVDVNQPQQLISSIQSQTDDDCFPLGSGSVIIKTTGGVGNILYSIDSGNTYQTSNIFNSLKSGSYIIKSKDSNGCITQISTIILETPPQNNLNIIVNNGILTSPYNDPNFWYQQGNTIPIDTGLIFHCNSDGSYYVSGIDINGCRAISKIVNVKCVTANNDFGNDHYVSIYPNPTIDEFNLLISKIDNGSYTLNIFNLLGEKVLEYKFYVLNNNAHKSYSVRELNSGIYILNIDSDKFKFSTKLDVMNK